MTLPYLLRVKIIVLSVLAFSVMAISPAVIAQSEQPASTSADLYGASGQSSFQDAGAAYQQGSSGADYTASGSANVLNQVNNGQITVSGAPAYSATTETNNSAIKLWFSVIFFVSGIGLLAMYIYSKRYQQIAVASEQELAAEIIAETKPKSKKEAKKSEPKVEKSATGADAKVGKSTKTAKKTKAKSKKKKHHR